MEAHKIENRRANKGKNFNNKNKQIKEYERAPMLNLRRLGSFRYDIREVLSRSKVDEALASSVVANTIAKASRVSISEAKSYTREVQAQGGFDKEVSDAICSLLDRYSKYR